MSNFRKLKEMACEELEKEIDELAKSISNRVKTLESPTDIRVNPIYIRHVETILDRWKVPCHYVTEDCLSIGPTYNALYAYEKRR